jgi:hypothetical protein
MIHCQGTTHTETQGSNRAGKKVESVYFGREDVVVMKTLNIAGNHWEIRKLLTEGMQWVIDQDLRLRQALKPFLSD